MEQTRRGGMSMKADYLSGAPSRVESDLVKGEPFWKGETKERALMRRQVSIMMVGREISKVELGVWMLLKGVDGGSCLVWGWVGGALTGLTGALEVALDYSKRSKSLDKFGVLLALILEVVWRSDHYGLQPVRYGLHGYRLR